MPASSGDQALVATAAQQKIPSHSGTGCCAQSPAVPPYLANRSLCGVRVHTPVILTADESGQVYSAGFPTFRLAAREGFSTRIARPAHTNPGLSECYPSPTRFRRSFWASGIRLQDILPADCLRVKGFLQISRFCGSSATPARSRHHDSRAHQRGRQRCAPARHSPVRAA